jgi:phenylalanyl-tRNA synthetase alpha chain
MALRDDLEQARRDGIAQIQAAGSAEALESARIAFMGRSGRLKDIKDAFGQATPDEKRQLGPLMNEVLEAFKEALKQAQARLAGNEDDHPIDLTLPEQARRVGSIHPISRVAQDIEQVFTSMGFEVIDGPHVEEDQYNFGRLNIPADHPARDSQDTFWLKFGDGQSGRLLRTHTSAVQSRTYPAVKPPFRKVVVGRVFRYEAVDATHDNTFHQAEGFLVDKNITVAHLIGVITTMLKAVLKRDDVDIRLRPHFFPFVEPGFEVDVRLLHGEGRLARWMELLGCGMIHPKVLTTGGIDPNEWQGFAFGLGVERLTMMRHSIGDIRLFNGADLRGLRQFAG